MPEYGRELAGIREKFGFEIHPETGSYSGSVTGPDIAKSSEQNSGEEEGASQKEGAREKGSGEEEAPGGTN